MSWISLQICLQNFSILEESSEIWSKICICLHVKYRLFLSDFNETRNFLYCFPKNTHNTKFHEASSSGTRVVPCGYTGRWKDRRTDTQDEAKSRFSQFCGGVQKYTNCDLKMYRKGIAVVIEYSTLEPDWPQHELPAASVIAQQYSSSNLKICPFFTWYIELCIFWYW